MPKLVEKTIHDCDHCPWIGESRNESGRDVPWCLNTKDRKGREIKCDVIPDWCPLPNSPEGAHCADTPNA
jgi:hypothetical protein